MPFQVHLHPSGCQFSVEPGETILAAALRHGVTLPYGCRVGRCGTCMATLRAGRIGYDGDLPPGLEPYDIVANKILVCQARPKTDLVIETRELVRAGEIPIKNLPARVQDLEVLTHDIMRLRLKLPDSERMQFMAGQYIEILLKDGRRRAFSIANAPHDDAFIELHIRLIPGGQFTHTVFEEMKPKAMLRIEGPLGTYYLREDSSRPMILMGGGTGFAPLKGMLEHAFYIGIERPLHLFWGVRTRQDLYMQDLIQGWLTQHPNFRYTPVLSEPSVDDHWDGKTGLVMDAVARDYPDLRGHDVYMSGPPAMCDAARECFLAHDLPLDQMFSDAFEFGADVRGKAAGES